MTPPHPGLRANLPQFALLVAVNGFVGAMVGMERAILPAIAEDEFGLVARTAILSFIAVFGAAKAAANYAAGHLSDRVGRKPVLLAGWALSAPVPFMLMWAPDWSWFLAANALLGLGQGLAWSATVIMKIDLAGPRRRGLAMGLNEAAGYMAVAVGALGTGYLAARWGLRPQPFLIGVAAVVIGAGLSLTFVRETQAPADTSDSKRSPAAPGAREVFRRATWSDPDLSSASQAGFVNNLNDGLAWGLFPLVFAAAGLGLEHIGWLAAAYPAVWGFGQLFTGPLSDRLGRKPLIVAGMWTQALAIAVIAGASGFSGFLAGSLVLGVGTAMVYPTLLAAVADASGTHWRASAVGVYRLWRDLGYVAGALIAGGVADWLGTTAALVLVAALTAASGTAAGLRMTASTADGDRYGQQPVQKSTPETLSSCSFVAAHSGTVQTRSMPGSPKAPQTSPQPSSA